MRSVGIALVACAACGRIGFGGPTDGGGDPDARRDADSDAVLDTPPDAFPAGPFGTPTLVSPSSGTAADDDPTLTGDLLELYFISDRPGGPGAGDIWVARRTSPTLPWGTPTPVPAINSSLSEDNPSISLDGLTIWFASGRGGAGHDVFISTRPDRATAWTAPVLVTELSTAGEESSLGVSASRLRLMLARGVQPARELFEAARPTTSATWSALTPSSINTAADEASPLFVSDLEVWFTSDRAGGAGLEDLYMATRPTVTSPFGAASPVPGINTAMTDDDAWLSPDGHLLVFTSNRGGGTYDLYEATR